MSHDRSGRSFRYGIRFKIAVSIGVIMVALVAVDVLWNLSLQNVQAENEAREKAEAAERCQRDFTGCKVLVVDDDDLSREILVEILKDYGFKPEEARDGDAAVRKVASVEPFYYDAVLMDMRMPRMDGDEATREIRALDRPDAATLPIIAETADAFEEGQRRARDAHAKREDEQGVERDVDERRNDQIVQGPPAVAEGVKNARAHVVEHRCQHAEEVVAEVFDRLRHDLRVGVHPGQKRRREEYADERQQCARHDTERQVRVDGARDVFIVARAEVL